MAPQGLQTEYTRFMLPGFNLPLNWTPHEKYTKREYINGNSKSTEFPAQGEGKNLFHTALNDADIDGGWTSLDLTTLREFTMLHIMNSLTDKPHWEEKVFDDAIAEKWKAEAMAAPDRDVSQKMVDWVIEELRYKAKIFKETGAFSVYNGDVVKSDIAISDDVKQSLRAAVRPLEGIPEVYKDYHPGPDGKVLDLVHPSLFPLIYGKSRVLDGELIGLDDCVESCGKGVIVPIPSDIDTGLDRKDSSTYSLGHAAKPYSKNFQWLPCEVDISADDGTVKITSYINNLHPQKHRELYSIIEKVISQTILLWNMTLAPMKGDARYSSYERIKFQLEFDPDPDNMPEDERPQQEEDEDDDDYYDRMWQWEKDVRRAVQPEPGEFKPPIAAEHLKHRIFEPGTDILKPEASVDLRRDYAHRGLQIIVKLANIELSPEKPEYGGGTWHVEGQLNEHICATALYYYDNENITESHLAFRQQSSTDDADDVGYPQCVHDWLTEIFGCTNDEAAVQEVGSVVCKEGRLLTFPNILQHQVQPFKLADPTKPGHRKILALFLVDPGIRIISTANVPPQQRHWWSEGVTKAFANSGEAMGQLSAELKEKVFEDVEDFPIGMEEAKAIRLQLMDERKSYVTEQGWNFEKRTFSLCEH